LGYLAKFKDLEVRPGTVCYFFLLVMAMFHASVTVTLTVSDPGGDSG